jgi:hypothetical protein
MIDWGHLIDGELHDLHSGEHVQVKVHKDEKVEGDEARIQLRNSAVEKFHHHFQQRQVLQEQLHWPHKKTNIVVIKLNKM